MPLSVLPTSRVDAEGMSVANIMDFKLGANIAIFGMCNNSKNPTVIANTAAAQGVHTPGACAPIAFTPWSPGSSTVTVGGQPALTKDSKCKCNWGGDVTVDDEGSKNSSVG
jgi:hypothetical protein